MKQNIQLRGIWAVGCALILAFALGLYSAPELVDAHGTNITYSVESTVLVDANFDTGEPMSEAQV